MDIKKIYDDFKIAKIDENIEEKQEVNLFLEFKTVVNTNLSNSDGGIKDRIKINGNLIRKMIWRQIK